MERRTLALLSSFALLAGCRSDPHAHAEEPPPPPPLMPEPRSMDPLPPGREPAAKPDEAQLPAYTLVLIKTGPLSGKLAKSENDAAFAGHFSNMARLADERKLLVAGPYGQSRHDQNLRGLFVLASASRDEARSWAETDPTTKAGVFVLEFHDLATEAPLLAALERDIAWRKEEGRAGRTPPPGDGARPYVLLTAEHGDLAERELGSLRTREGGVLMLARLDGSRAFVLLDAENVAGARERFGPQLDNLGAYALDEWFASDQLARMVE